MIELFERSFNPGFAVAQDQDLIEAAEAAAAFRLRLPCARISLRPCRLPEIALRDAATFQVRRFFVSATSNWRLLIQSFGAVVVERGKPPIPPFFAYFLARRFLGKISRTLRLQNEVRAEERHRQFHH